jgi:hypothetical protein
MTTGRVASRHNRRYYRKILIPLPPPRASLISPSAFTTSPPMPGGFPHHAEWQIASRDESALLRAGYPPAANDEMTIKVITEHFASLYEPLFPRILFDKVPEELLQRHIGRILAHPGHKYSMRIRANPLAQGVSTVPLHLSPFAHPDCT